MTYRQQRYSKNAIAWVIIVGTILTIFMLGAIFGYHLTKHAQTHKSDGAVADNINFATNCKIVPGLALDLDLQKVMYESCQKYDVPFALALAVAEKESDFNVDAISETDDYGIMQINACNFKYFRDCGIDPLSYEGNIEAGVMLLGEYLEMYGDEELALMAYNCGCTGAQELWDTSTYSTIYSRSVMKLYEKWIEILGSE